MDLPSLFLMLYLWLCHSMRLCVARHLVVVHNELPRTQLDFSGQVAENLKEQTLELTGRTKEEDMDVKINAIIGISEGSKLANEIHLETSQSSGRKMLSGLIAAIHKDQHPGFYSDYSRPRTRYGILKFYHMGLLKATSVKGSRRCVLSVMGPPKDKEEQDAQEDIEVKDYAGPHQTPPVHHG